MARGHKSTLLALLALVGCQGLDSRPVPPPAVRSTVLDDTGTTAARRLELEAGTVVDPGDLGEAFVTFKWGASARLEAFVAGFPWRVVARPGPDPDGPGMAEIGVRHRFLDETSGSPAGLYRLGLLLPVGDDDVQASDELGAVGSFTLTKTLGGIGFHPTWEVTLLDDPSGSGVDVSHVLGVLASAPVGDAHFAFFEVAGVLVPEADVENLLLQGGGGWLPSSALALDLGLTVGFGDTAPDLALALGCTWTLPHD